MKCKLKTEWFLRIEIQIDKLQKTLQSIPESRFFDLDRKFIQDQIQILQKAQRIAKETID